MALQRQSSLDISASLQAAIYMWAFVHSIHLCDKGLMAIAERHQTATSAATLRASWPVTLQACRKSSKHDLLISTLALMSA